MAGIFFLIKVPETDEKVEFFKYLKKLFNVGKQSCC